MYPASERAGWSADAQLSLMKLWGSILLCLMHLNMWSPQASCVMPHGQVGVLADVKIGRRSFRLSARVKLQFGRRLFLLLRHIDISGYDVCGTRILGSRCICS